MLTYYMVFNYIPGKYVYPYQGHVTFKYVNNWFGALNKNAAQFYRFYYV